MSMRAAQICQTLFSIIIIRCGGGRWRESTEYRYRIFLKPANRGSEVCVEKRKSGAGKSAVRKSIFKNTTKLIQILILFDSTIIEFMIDMP